MGQDADARTQLLDMIAAIPVPDELALRHRDAAIAWAGSGAQLWRTAKPATPPMHLVSYFVLRDPDTRKWLLVHHRKAGLLLPAGGHVEIAEHPWDTVVREAGEELRHTPATGPQPPVFLTVTETRGADVHTDVSLWFVLEVREQDITWYDEGEFDGIVWLSTAEILATPIDRLDPHLHRFVGAFPQATALT